MRGVCLRTENEPIEFYRTLFNVSADAPRSSTSIEDARLVTKCRGSKGCVLKGKGQG